jgi:hypothetical protein
MLEGITAHHERISSVNPRWILDLLRQLATALLPATTDPLRLDTGTDSGVVSGTGSRYHLDGDTPVHLQELQAIVHRQCPWWV